MDREDVFLMGINSTLKGLEIDYQISIKAWLHPSVDLADSASLYEGLRQAAVDD
jgi:hypothetical protein